MKKSSEEQVNLINYWYTLYAVLYFKDSLSSILPKYYIYVHMFSLEVELDMQFLP